jgi:GxxExxY protein
MTGGTTRAGLELVHGNITGSIIGAFYDVYNELGYGFAEAVCQRALAVEFSIRDVSSERELALTVRYKGVVVEDYRADLIAEGRVIVECKAVDKIIPAYEMQLLNYLKATGIAVGLILNFGPRPSFRRLLFSSPQEGSAVIRA